MFKSTRDNISDVFSYEAILYGLVPSGGLFVPSIVPSININDLKGLDYLSIATKIMSSFLDGFTEKEVRSIVNNSYSNFDTPKIVPVKKLNSSIYVAELFHGPTRAFKDVALQTLPNLIVESQKKLNDNLDIVILVATSGDTGSAALEGFKNISGTKIICLYPFNGVSDIQRKQMSTIDGKNTFVYSIKGNFDDCQNTVKSIFQDTVLRKELKSNGFKLSSANSINWGRLMPQIVYYYNSYINMVEEDSIKMGDKINVCVPTGNFGNILAAWYAKSMGVPIDKLICASNKNDVLVKFFHEGIYCANREFYKTNSPSMDIIISSNLERYIFEKCGRDGKLVNSLYNDLSAKGEFKISEELLVNMQKEVYSNFANEEEINSYIKSVNEKYSYLIDPHTAVAFKVYDDYVKDTFDTKPTLICATASPLKFSLTVNSAIYNDKIDEKDAFTKLSLLMDKNDSILTDIWNKKELFKEVIEKDEIIYKVKKHTNL